VLGPGNGLDGGALVPGLRAGYGRAPRPPPEYFGPILGVMKADTLEEAVRLQNARSTG
jgi:hypothetical protein